MSPLNTKRIQGRGENCWGKLNFHGNLYPWVQAAGRVAVGGEADKKTGGGSTTDNGGSSAANTLVPTILLLILASRFI